MLLEWFLGFNKNPGSYNFDFQLLTINIILHSRTQLCDKTYFYKLYLIIIKMVFITEKNVIYHQIHDNSYNNSF